MVNYCVGLISIAQLEKNPIPLGECKSIYFSVPDRYDPTLKTRELITVLESSNKVGTA